MVEDLSFLARLPELRGLLVVDMTTASGESQDLSPLRERPNREHLSLAQVTVGSLAPVDPVRGRGPGVVEASTSTGAEG